MSPSKAFTGRSLGTPDRQRGVERVHAGVPGEYDRVPSGPAQLAYSQTLQYAAAAERAGTFYPPEVTASWRLRVQHFGKARDDAACDNQAQRDSPRCSGLPASEQSDGNFIDIVEITSRDGVGYACDSGPAAECELGEYGDE